MPRVQQLYCIDSVDTRIHPNNGLIRLYEGEYHFIIINGALFVRTDDDRSTWTECWDGGWRVRCPPYVVTDSTETTP